MKPSAVKPNREELQARVESLAKKKRSVKRKAQAPPKSSLAIRGKIPRLGASSPSSTAKERGPFDQVSARLGASFHGRGVQGDGFEKSFGEDR